MKLKVLILFTGITLVGMASLSSAAEVDRMMITTATAKPILQEANHAKLANIPDVLGDIDYAEMTSDEMQGIRGEGRIWTGSKWVFKRATSPLAWGLRYLFYTPKVYSD
jgi:hypothetical protein